MIPVAYLCLGYPVEFPPEPVLQSAGWRGRLELESLIHFDGWEGGIESVVWEDFKRAVSETGEHNGGPPG